MKTGYLLSAVISVSLVFLGVGCWLPSVFSENPRLSGRTDVLEDWGVESGDDPVTDRLAANCVSDQCLAVEGLEYPVAVLPDKVRAALESALDNLYLVVATHEAGLKKHGAVRPFAMVVRAEELHVVAVKSLFDKYGLRVPDNQYLGNVQPAETLSGSCRESARVEAENVKAYREEILPTVKGYPDLERVLGNVVGASEEIHLAAFDVCVN
jgi:hypothetical protein